MSRLGYATAITAAVRHSEPWQLHMQASAYRAARENSLSEGLDFNRTRFELKLSPKARRWTEPHYTGRTSARQRALG